MPTTIFLTRHGKTAANLENRFAGRTGEPLHQQGCEQLAGVADKLKEKQINAIYTGPLARTSQSAEIISKVTGASLHTSEPFNEILIPHWDGLTKEEITAQFGPEYPTWLSSPDKFNLPDCETLNQVQERAAMEIEKIFRERAGETVAVVSHLIVVRCLVLYYRRQPISEFRSIKIDNGSISRLTRNDEGRTEVRLDG
ncbi:MAG: histidine phosphatase family protein [Desulfobulbaceae bacterium]|nr:histidine phosphatase family protein [Desulfobulbaceae bacterium]